MDFDAENLLAHELNLVNCKKQLMLDCIGHGADKFVTLYDQRK